LNEKQRKMYQKIKIIRGYHINTDELINLLEFVYKENLRNNEDYGLRNKEDYKEFFCENLFDYEFHYIDKYGNMKIYTQPDYSKVGNIEFVVGHNIKQYTINKDYDTTTIINCIKKLNDGQLNENQIEEKDWKSNSELHLDLQPLFKGKEIGYYYIVSDPNE